MTINVIKIIPHANRFVNSLRQKYSDNFHKKAIAGANAQTIAVWRAEYTGNPVLTIREKSARTTLGLFPARGNSTRRLD